MIYEMEAEERMWGKGKEKDIKNRFHNIYRGVVV